MLGGGTGARSVWEWMLVLKRCIYVVMIVATSKIPANSLLERFFKDFSARYVACVAKFDLMGTSTLVCVAIYRK